MNQELCYISLTNAVSDGGVNQLSSQKLIFF